ncbi:hypothetical protein HOE04_05570 [archaeon]|jgi:hypothetical protein|nr:hypothetical protein [archaeon]
MKNKKGEGMSWILITFILAMIVLVVLAIGFTTGFKNTWQKITGFGGGDSNVADIVRNCGNVYCPIGDDYNYCKKQPVVFDKVDGKDNPDNGRYSCEQLSRGFNVGLDECGSIVCESGCSDLEFEECQYEEDEKCVVEWVGRPSFEKHERMADGGELSSVEDLTHRVAFEEADKKGDGWVCEKRVLN